MSKPIVHGFGVGTGIVDRRFVAQRVEILAREALDEMQPIGVRIADHVDPAAFVESHDIDDEGVLLPVSDRVSKPRRVQ